MYSTTVQNTLKLLALSVFIDKRVYANEIAAFMDSTDNLDVLTDSDNTMTSAKLLEWFEANQHDLKTQLSKTSEFKSWLRPILDDLADHKEKYAILNRMIKISKADGEFHKSEENLISLTAKHWDVRLAF